MAQKFTVPITVKQLASAGSDAVTVYVDADTYARLKLEAGGRLVWGSGSGAGDTNLYRDEADTLKTDDNFKVGGKLSVVASSGDEGGEIFLAPAQTNSTLNGGVTIDVYQNKIRFFEQGGSARGAYIDLTATTGGAGTNLLAGGGGGATTLDGLTDVTAPTPSNGDLIQWNGTAWVNVASSTVGATNLDGLSDVVITSPEEFQGLSYNGTNWVNGHIPLVSYVRNAESTTITTGTCVYLFGATGDHATVKRADNNSDTTSSKTIGVAGANITASNNGPIVTRGYVDGIDLSVGYAAGDVLWLGENGAFTKTKPTAPDHLVFIGVVVRATNNGIIYVATQNGYELDELHNVSIPSPISGDFLKYNGSLWVNDQINLGTDTVGNYVSSVTAGTGISVDFTPSEGAGASVSLNATLNDLSNVDVATPTGGYVLTYDDIGTNWVAAAVQPPTKLDNIGDVKAGSPSNGDLLKYDGGTSEWKNGTLAIDELSDVSAASPTTGNLLTYNGSAWTAAEPVSVEPSTTVLDGGRPNTLQFYVMGPVDAGGVT